MNALFVGVLIPLLSSIIPIKRGLSANITETLDISRSKNKGVLLTVIDNKVLKTVPFLAQGSIAVIFGIMVYYGMPYALLQFNIGLLLTIFFILLMGMLFGLVLIAINLQPMIEQAMLYLLLFWERKSMRAVLKKNLTAHKRKNRLTAIIYALSLGCIIFLLTAVNMQMHFIT